MRVELIRFHKKYKLYSGLRLRREELRTHSMFTAYSPARWQQLVTTKLISTQCQPIR